MKYHSLPWVALAALVASTAAGCERVAFYSVTGGGSDDPGTTTTQPVTTTTGTGTPTVTRSAVLEAVGTCATALYADVAQAAAALDAATSAAAASSDPAKKEAARAAWVEVMARWQQAEIIGVGPAGPAAFPGGKGMRDLVYSWPLVSRCLVEQAIVSKEYEKPSFTAAGLVNKRGLAALEYLLFYEGTDNACSPSSSINSTGAWAAMNPAELAARKGAYASVVAADVAAKTKAIAGAWPASGEDFAGELATAGQGGSLFDSDQVAMNGVTAGLFYLETETKDLKLGCPLGIVDPVSCPQGVESPYAKLSRDHIRYNLLGFRRVFEGCDESAGMGVDDLMIALGASALAEEMKAGIESSLAAADAVPTSDLSAALAQDEAKVAALHSEIRKITTPLKTQFASVLAVEIPGKVEGDND